MPFKYNFQLTMEKPMETLRGSYKYKADKDKKSRHFVLTEKAD